MKTNCTNVSSLCPIIISGDGVAKECCYFELAFLGHTLNSFVKLVTPAFSFAFNIKQGQGGPKI